MIHRSRSALAVLTAAALLSACTAGAEDATQEAVQEVASEVRVIQPGAPGEPSRVLSSEEVAALDLAPPEHTEADVRFMQNMLPHHAQALDMTSLVNERTSRDDIPLFAERIDISQEDEIALMERWLEERGEEVPDVEAHSHSHEEHDHLMPGMLTDEELAQLEAADGIEFDRLFLEFMRKHHEGAVLMVEELFAADGGQEPEIFQFATHIDSDQRIEISRIDMMLEEVYIELGLLEPLEETEDGSGD